LQVVVEVVAFKQVEEGQVDYCSIHLNLWLQPIMP
jgi:hypothetical protein